MATLLEQLRQQGPTGEQTQQVQSLLSARTGKATAPGAAPRATNIQEQVQDQLTRGQLADTAQQASMQAQQQGQEQRAVEQQFQQQRAQLNEQDINTQEAYQRQVEASLKDYQRNIKQLNVAKQAAKVEQLGFQLRLSNQNYIMQLKDAAARDRITNAVSFNEALQRTIFKDEIDLLSSDLDFRMLLKADEAEFQKMLAKIDIDTALAIAAASAKDSATQSIVSGVNKFVTAGATYTSRADTTTMDLTGDGDGSQVGGGPNTIQQYRMP
jgi:hypothetical protein